MTTVADAISILSGAKLNPVQRAALTRLADLASDLKNVVRYDHQISGCCGCCESWVEHEREPDGDWVLYADLESLLL